VTTPLVAHLVPAPFDPEEGIVGGAERYAFELARHMAERIPTRLVTFGSEARQMRAGGLDVRILRGRFVRGQRTNPVSACMWAALSDASVVHCHQQHVLASSLAALAGRLRGTPVFATDLGGGGWDFSAYVSTDRWFRGHLHISEYSRRVFGHAGNPRARVILGGVDTRTFFPAGRPDPHVLFVGRLLPHKGVHDLIDAMPQGLELRIVGRALDGPYLRELRTRAAGKRVTFLHDVSDAQLLEEYRRAACVVLPSVHTTPDGRTTAVPELLGQTLLEAMACGRPVICTAVASMPEVVRDGETGFVVAPGNPAALRRAIQALADGPALAWRMGQAGVARARSAFSWHQVVDRCLRAYEEM